MHLIILLIVLHMSKFLQNSVLTKKPTADKMQVIIKDLEEYTITGKMHDILH